MTGSQKPKAPYVMDEIGGRHALEWLRDLKVPSTFGLRPASMFSTLDAGECNICLSCWHTFVDQRWHCKRKKGKVTHLRLVLMNNAAEICPGFDIYSEVDH